MLEGQRILVVEDEAIIAFDIECAIRAALGGIAGHAANLAKAIELANSARPSLAVLDFRLRTETSLPVAAQLYANGVPFLFHTASDFAELAEAWPQVPVVPKPAVPGRLVGALMALAKGQAPSRSHRPKNNKAAGAASVRIQVLPFHPPV
jgi:DNA-binding NarL/FixJ family response regulator